MSSEAVTYADEIEIMAAIRNRLRATHEELTTKTCFLCDTPIPTIIPDGQLCVTISNAGTRYDESTYMGAGANALDNELTVMVTVIKRCVLDSPPKTEDALLHETRGILRYRRTILKALLVSDDWYCEGHKDQWVLEVDQHQVLRERGPIPRGWTAPRYERIGDHSYLSTALTLTLNFDQDL